MSTDLHRGRIITLRLNAVEEAAWRRAARRISLSELIRRAVDRYLAEQVAGGEQR